MSKTIEELKQEAKELGIRFVPNISAEKLSAKIEEFYDSQETSDTELQEALDKKKELNRTVEWHLIGHLQTNKVKQAVLNFDLIHSVDSERLAVEINKVANSLNKVQEILVQVNVVNEINLELERITIPLQSVKAF